MTAVTGNGGEGVVSAPALMCQSAFGQKDDGYSRQAYLEMSKRRYPNITKVELGLKIEEAKAQLRAGGEPLETRDYEDIEGQIKGMEDHYNEFEALEKRAASMQ